MEFIQWVNSYLSRPGWLTAAFIIATFIAWIGFDAFTGPLGMPTESQVIAFWARHVVFWDFLFGALVGHWFFGRRSGAYDLWFIPFLVIFVLVGWDIFWVRKNGWVEIWYRSPWIWVIVGVVFGLFCWPQIDPESFIP